MSIKDIAKKVFDATTSQIEKLAADRERMDWLEEDPERLEHAHLIAVSDQIPVRDAIDRLRKVPTDRKFDTSESA